MPQHINLGPHMSQWEIATTIAIAKHIGIQAADIDDVIQEVAIKLLDFTHDSQRASARTVVHALIHHTAVDFLRAGVRRLRRVGHAQAQEGMKEPSVFDTTAFSDLWEAVGHLNEQEQAICRGLSEGRSIREIATRSGTSWFRVNEVVARLRVRFADMGFAGGIHE